ncbi:hypothetical protein BCR39DRAFT_598464 [Naematelia encephala]|uniref:TPX2 C-terminal domain-containing protein n=1 Tax=Naematelia encephala TaxID=71784 RepID=A0A1Y2B6P6_9TREE|nr:hypothetical protein BCR39DRAFT_598464 [Naematelia encephala]
MPPIPPTPFLPNIKRYADASLLLDEPIFGDITLDEDDYGTPTAGPSTLPDVFLNEQVDVHNDASVNANMQAENVRTQEDLTFDLNEYLPDSDDRASSSIPSVKSGRGGMKRDGSSSLLRDMERSSGKQARLKDRNDLYHRRLSSSSHRLENIRPASPMFPSLPSRGSSPFLASTSVSSRSKSPVSSDVGARVREEQHRWRKKQEEKQEPVQEEFIPLPPKSRPTALSRYLAKSTILHPHSTLPDLPLVRSNPEHLTPTAPVEFTSTSSSSSSNPEFSSSSHPFAEIDQNPSHRQSRLPTPDIIEMQSSPPKPTLERVDASPPTISTPPPPPETGASSSTTSKESRRTSTGERVLGFFASFIKRPEMPSEATPISNDLARGDSSDKGIGENREEAPKGDIRDDWIDTIGSGNYHFNENIRPSHAQFVAKSHQLLKSKSYFALTKPRPFAASTRQPLRHSRTVASSSNIQPVPPSQVNPKSQTMSQTKPVAKPYARPANPIPPPKPRLATTSSFTASALARLPPPGKGSSRAAEPLSVKPIERAADLAKRRAVFERSGTSRPVANAHDAASPSKNLPKTIPIRGHTPGKASRMRAEQRSRFDAAVRERMEEKEQLRREEERKRRQEEKEAYLRSRKETVIWAKPVPDIYLSTKE